MIDLNLNYELVTKFITKFIEEETKSNGFSHVVLGVSGGVDSALVAKLAVLALGKENVLAFSFPIN